MGVFKGERTHLAKKLDEVSAVDTLAFHFTRPLWELGESVSPKQSALHWVGINHLLGVCGRCDMNRRPWPWRSRQREAWRWTLMNTCLEVSALAQDFRGICDAHFSVLLLL